MCAVMSTASINKTPFLWCQFYDCILQASSLLAIKLNSIYEWQPWLVLPHSNILIIYSLWSASPPVWPDWATFWSLWQQLICPNLPHSLAIFVKVSKSIIFLLKSFLLNFYRVLAIFFWSHCLRLEVWTSLNNKVIEMRYRFWKSTNLLAFG